MKKLTPEEIKELKLFLRQDLTAAIKQAITGKKTIIKQNFVQKPKPGGCCGN